MQSILSCKNEVLNLQFYITLITAHHTIMIIAMSHAATPCDDNVFANLPHSYYFYLGNPFHSFYDYTFVSFVSFFILRKKFKKKLMININTINGLFSVWEFIIKLFNFSSENKLAYPNIINN